MKKLLVVTEAWHPQVNGVVRTLENTVKTILDPAFGTGLEIHIVDPSQFKTFRLPFYNEIRIAYDANQEKIGNYIRNIEPDYIHIVTEGPLGYAFSKHCVTNGIKFTTSYHTMFPEYAAMYYGLPKGLTYAYLRWFHDRSSNIMVNADSMFEVLRKQGFNGRLSKWSRGVDCELFNPIHRVAGPPYALYVGRVAKEKNLTPILRQKISARISNADFTTGDKPWDLAIIGDGPMLKKYRKKYPEVNFLGALKSKELASWYANASVFVFPSKSDTFGLVMIEALASGTPVVAFNVQGAKDIVKPGVGYLVETDKQLMEASYEASKTINRDQCRQYILEKFTWPIATRQFMSNLVPAS